MRFLVFLVLALALTACGSGSGAQPAQPTAEPVDGGLEASSDQRFPNAAIEDVASFADQLAIVRIEKDRALPFSSPEERAAGEGYLPRLATLSVEETLWRRGGAPTSPPDVIEMELLGWLAKSDKEPRKFVDGLGPWPEVGDRVLMAMVVVHETWSPYSSDTTWPLRDRTTLDIEGARTSSYVGERLAGQSADAIAAAVAAAKPYAVTLEHPDLSAEDRLEIMKRGEPTSTARGPNEVP